MLMKCYLDCTLYALLMATIYFLPTKVREDSFPDVEKDLPGPMDLSIIARQLYVFLCSLEHC